MTRRAQRGAALLTAMVIVTLVATLAAAMVWQQWRAVQVEAAERAQSQSQWVLRGALDWAQLVLIEDGRTSAGVDHLGEPWALPLAESRLSTFLAADRDNSEDAQEAFLSGQIQDAQRRYNLYNLIAASGSSASPGTPSPRAIEQATLTALCNLVGVSGDVATRLAEQLARTLPAATNSSTSSQSTPSSNSSLPANTPLLPPSAEDLRWLGVDDASMARLASHLTLLPRTTPVNLNTATREVLAAVLGVTLADAERLVQLRQRSPFKSVQDASSALAPNIISKAGSRIATNTSYFEVTGVLRLEALVVAQRSLVERNGTVVKVLSSQRIRRPDELAKPLQQ